MDLLERMAKLVRQEAEKARVSVRNARRDALDAMKPAFNSEDERQRAKKQVGGP